MPNPVPIDCGAPDLEPILRLHRGIDSYINFRVNDHHCDIFSICVADLRDMFPAVQHHLTRNAYFSINGFWRRGLRASRFDPNRHVVSRARENLRYLNACFTDLDGYRLGKSADQLTREVLQMMDTESIPSPSILAKSGRGVWLFWLLHDAQDVNLPQRAFNDRVDVYRKLQRAIAERFSRFVADAQDASRVARVPGSLNSKSDVVVQYQLLGDASGRPPTYSLRELADRFGVKPKQYHANVNAARDEPESKERNRGWRLLQAKRLRQFETLRSIRGGFSEGCRNYAAVLYTHFLTKNGIRGVDLERHLEEFAAECRPSLSNSELRGAIQTGRKMKTGSWSISNVTIAQWLHITPDEADQLEGWSPAPCFCDPAARSQSCEATTRAERAAARHAAIIEIVSRLRGRVPSLRMMTDLLKEFGHDVSHITIRNDYRALKLNPPATPGSPSDPSFFDTSIVA